MHEQIFVNLPVKDLQRSTEFFKQLGYSFDERFTDANTSCLLVGRNIAVMLLAEPFFKTFIGDKAVADAHASNEALVCLSCASREEVDALVARAQAAGGRVPSPPQDHGSMYSHCYEDLDGHVWELIHLAAQPPQG